MSYRELDENSGLCRKIEVIAATSGWMVTEEGHIKAWFDDVEAAYQKALSICAALFDAGIPARVFQTST